MCLVETKLVNCNTPIKSSTPNGYSNFHIERIDGSKGGGIAIIYKTSYKCERLKTHPDIITSTFESLIIRVTPENRASFILVVIYRPPSSSASTFVDQFINLYNHIVDDYHDNVIFVGDMNIHVNKTNESVPRKFLDFLHDFSLQNHIHVPTFSSARVSSDEWNTLDLVIDSSFHNLVLTARVSFELSFSDHAMIFFDLNIDRVKLIKTDKIIPVCSFNDDNRKFFNDLLWESSPEILNENNSSQVSLKLNKLLRQSSEASFPSNLKAIKVVEDNPWYNSINRTAKVESRRRERDYLRQVNNLNGNTDPRKIRALQEQVIEAKTALKAALKSKIRTLEESKKSYFTRMFEKYSNNPRKSFEFINILLGRKNPEILPDIAYEEPDLFDEKYNAFLQSKMLKIRKDLERSNVSKKALHITRDYEPLFNFRPLSMPEFDELCKKVNITSSILNPVKFDKVIDLDSVKSYLLHLVNTALVSGEFPNSEKVSVVRPLIKDINGDRNNFNNYRPITNISMVAKYIEYAMYEQLSELINEHKLLPDFQSAYRPIHSTETALCRVYNDLIFNKDAGKCTVMTSHVISRSLRRV